SSELMLATTTSTLPRRYRASSSGSIRSTFARWNRLGCACMSAKRYCAAMASILASSPAAASPVPAAPQPARRMAAAMTAAGPKRDRVIGLLLSRPRPLRELAVEPGVPVVHRGAPAIDEHLLHSRAHVQRVARRHEQVRGLADL